MHGHYLLKNCGVADAKEIADDIEKSEAQPIVSDEYSAVAVRKQASEMISTFRSSKRCLENDDASLRCSKKRVTGENDGNIEGLFVRDPEAKCVSGLLEEVETRSKATIVACLVSDLFESMFDSKWEVRHGALLSLRQVFVSAHFTTAVEATRLAQAHNHVQDSVVDKWLEECLIRCICVLALDRFVDYSADGSVSPVREVCAQVFGILLGSVSGEATLVRYLQVVRTLFSGLTWHACHGGLLGIKYLVQAHGNHGSALVPLFFNDIVTVFSQAVAEEDVLVLAVDMIRDFVSCLNQVEPVAISNTATLLWGSLKLHEKSGLISAGIIQAISAWYHHFPVAALLQRDKRVKEALWNNLSYTVPMLHHHLQSVRVSSATCTAAILSDKSTSVTSRIVVFGQAFLSHLLFQVFVETNEPVRRSLLSAWKQVVSTLSNDALLVDVAAEYLPLWAKLLLSADEIHKLNVEVMNMDGTVISADVSNFAEQTTWENMASRVAFAKAIGFVAAHVPLDDSCTTELVRLFHDGIRSTSGDRQSGVLLALTNWGHYENKLGRKNLEDYARRLQCLRSSVGLLMETFSKHQWKIVHSDAQSEEEAALYSEQRASLKRVMLMEAQLMHIFSSVGVTLQPSK